MNNRHFEWIEGRPAMAERNCQKGKAPQLAAILLIACIATSLVAGCDLKISPPPGSSGQETVTVTDCLGRQVTLDSKPQRIACLYAFSGHVVTMLGASDRIVAVVEGLKRDRLLTMMHPEIADLPVPSNEGSVNIEELMACQPDLVFVKRETAANPGEAAKLDKAGIKYIAVDYFNMQEQMDIVVMIGQAIGAPERARAYVDFYQEQIRMVEERIAGLTPDERVRVYHSVNEASRTDSRGTLPADWLEAAGADNVSIGAELKFYENKYYASLEQIYIWDPEVILANEPGVAAYMLGHEQWQGLKAVAAGTVYQMPVGISRWGHPGSLETPLALVWTARLLYPERCADIDMQGLTGRFYRDFFGLELDPNQIEEILSGQGMRLSKEEAGEKEEQKP